MKHPWVMGSLMLLSLNCLGQERALNKALSDSPRAFALYTSEGIPASWDAFVAEAMASDVVLFGELHDDPIMHWLQAELIRNMLAEGVHPTLGAEMLEADDQLVVDEFLQGWLNDDKLKAAANLWPNHKTDYHPLLELAKENDLPFIATNIPRRYASFVYMNGLEALETLSDDAKSFLPLFPFLTTHPCLATKKCWRWAEDTEAKTFPWPKRPKTRPWLISFQRIVRTGHLCSFQRRLPQQEQ